MISGQSSMLWGQLNAGGAVSVHGKALKERESEGAGPSQNCSTGNLAWRIMPQKQINIPWINSPSSSHFSILKSSSQSLAKKSYMFMIFKNTIFFTYNPSEMSAPHRWKCAGALVKMFSATEPWKSLCHRTGSAEIRQAGSVTGNGGGGGGFFSVPCSSDLVKALS